MSFLNSPESIASQHSNTGKTGALTAAEHMRKKTIKNARKKKEGTDGIDACDERESFERLSDGFEMMSQDE